MKQKFALVVVLCMFVVAANAQSFGVKAGLSFPSQSYEWGSFSYDPEMFTGFHAGVVAELPLLGNLYVNTGLLYAQKGSKIDDLGTEVINKFNYLELPVNLAYKVGIGPLAIFPQAGVFFDYALNGKTVSENVSQAINFKEDGLKQVDFGLNVGAGVQVSLLQVTVNYGFGLVNIADVDSEYWEGADTSIKNGVLSVSAAILF